MARLCGDWPFAVGKSPVFYDWIMSVIATLGILLSLPGQIMGVAVFLDAIIDVTGLTRTDLFLAYMLGTIKSVFSNPDRSLVRCPWGKECIDHGMPDAGKVDTVFIHGRSSERIRCDVDRNQRLDYRIFANGCWLLWLSLK